MRELFRYYYGSVSEQYEDGAFAVANADEIPASCKNIRELYARDQQEAFDMAMQVHRDSYRTTYAQ